MSIQMADRTALVLGGGGITGAAWEIGLLVGLAEAGVDLTTADLVVGTSAGAVVGAQVLSGVSIEDLYARQLKRRTGTQRNGATSPRSRVPRSVRASRQGAGNVGRECGGHNLDSGSHGLGRRRYERLPGRKLKPVLKSRTAPRGSFPRVSCGAPRSSGGHRLGLACDQVIAGTRGSSSMAASIRDCESSTSSSLPAKYASYADMSKWPCPDRPNRMVRLSPASRAAAAS